MWVDVLTPKQALFTKAMLERAPSDVELLITTRYYSELNKFLSQLKMEPRSFGRHGGPTVQGKLEASIERMRQLVPFIAREKPDCSFSFISPEAARVSFGVGLQHYICSDSPHAVAVCKLSIPLSSYVFTPFVIKSQRWTQYGIAGSRILTYRALDPWAWLISKKRGKIAINRRNESVVLIRLEESQASYVKSDRGISNALDKLIPAINSQGDFEVVIIPRYDEQREWARKKFGGKCTVPKSTVEGTDLISKASLLIGGGGTMTQEAALLGVPNISYFPSLSLDIFEDYCFPEKLSIKASTPLELVKETEELLENIDKVRSDFGNRAQKAVSGFEDPVKIVFKAILENVGKK
jgi:predicted glycosyltransferase